MGNCLIIGNGATSKVQVYHLGIGTSFNVRTILNNQGISKPESFYNNLTVDNFLASSISNQNSIDSWSYSGYFFLYGNQTKSYDNSTAVLTWYYRLDSELYKNRDQKFDVYLVIYD